MMKISRSNGSYVSGPFAAFRLALISMAIFIPGTLSAAGAPDEVPLPPTKPLNKSGVIGGKIVTEDAWSEQAIADAQKACFDLLAARLIIYEKLSPIKVGACGDPAPLKVTAFGQGENMVRIEPPAVLNCKITAHLADWFEKVVQPSARAVLKSPVARIRNVSSFACRHRYSNPKKRLSEHAFANALDIASFITRSGKTVTLTKDWGVTQRELRQREKLHREKIARERQMKIEKAAAEKAAAEKRTKPDVTRGPYKGDREDRFDTIDTGVANKFANLTSAGDQMDWSAQTVTVNVDMRSPEEKAQERDPKRLFLRDIYDAACGIFGTVLSPEANHAHRDHFHFDMAVYRRKSYCE